MKTGVYQIRIGFKQAKVGKMFGIHQSTVSDIKRGKRRG